MALSPPSANMMDRMNSVWRRRTCVRQQEALNMCFKQAATGPQQAQGQPPPSSGGGNAAAPMLPSSSTACAAYLSALRTCDLHSHQPTSAFHRPHY